MANILTAWRHFDQRRMIFAGRRVELLPLGYLASYVAGYMANVKRAR
jgi:hypothetical protein